MSAEAATPRRRFPIGLTISVLICEIVLIGLGVWQYRRLQWKTAVLAHVAALRNAPSSPLQPALARVAAGQDVTYTRATVACAGLAHAPFLEVYGIRDGGAGARLVSACPLPPGAPYGSILVDRGFVPDTANARPAVDPASSAPLTVTGVLRRPDPRGPFSLENVPSSRLWYWRDTIAMAAALHAPRPAPVFLAAETATNPELPSLTPTPVPADIPNNHFAYMLTWFGLAAGLAGVYLAMLFGRRSS